LAAEGLLEEAVLRLDEALRLDPKHLDSLCLSGWVAWNSGDRDAASRRYRQALQVSPQHFNSLYHLAYALYDQQDPGPAAAAFKAALDLRPDDAAARFYLGVCLFDQGLEDPATKHFDKVDKHPGGFGFLTDSWRYMIEHRSPKTRSFACTFETLEHGIDNARSDGLVLEFGVLHGRTLNHIAEHVKGTVHGFDSFEGLPEAWGGNPKGSYSTCGRLPSLKPGVVLHPGWFDETLGKFVTEEQSSVRFMNVDCDLYSSTATIFRHLGKQIMPGSVIVFDEYLCTARCWHDEFRAFQEAALEYGWKYEYLAYNLFSKQASVRITA
jgi:tetratricopeptide (TPR) repeat protein